MAIDLHTQKPKELLDAFDARIAQKEEKGKITTWERVVANSKIYYTHKAENWHKKAYFFPSVSAGKLTFNIVRPAEGKVTTLVYAYYHGHLTETFLNHFDQSFSQAVSTALPTSSDDVGP